jgi:sugar phosphate isomerase/epimerase
MKPHAALAAENGVTIGIENHISNLIDTPDSLRWLADDIRELPGIGIALAPYHLPQDTKLLSELIRHIDRKMMLFYAWEHGKGCMKPMPKDEELQQMPGRGPLDWKPLLDALKAVNFTGPTEVFMHPTPRGIPILPTAAETTAEIVRAKEHLDKLVG